MCRKNGGKKKMPAWFERLDQPFAVIDPTCSWLMVKQAFWCVRSSGMAMGISCGNLSASRAIDGRMLLKRRSLRSADSRW